MFLIQTQDDDDVSEETATVMSVPAGGGKRLPRQNTIRSLIAVARWEIHYTEDRDLSGGLWAS